MVGWYSQSKTFSSGGTFLKWRWNFFCLDFEVVIGGKPESLPSPPDDFVDPVRIAGALTLRCFSDCLYMFTTTNYLQSNKKQGKWQSAIGIVYLNNSLSMTSHYATYNDWLCSFSSSAASSSMILPLLHLSHNFPHFLVKLPLAMALLPPPQLCNLIHTYILSNNFKILPQK